MGAHKETLGFQAEVKQLLRLMVHSLYSNKEIFLRELVSNASDACDKLRFEAIAKPELLEGRAEPAIRISFDKDARTVTVSDDGIGMSREEAVEHLGTIARSGTREFLASLSGEAMDDAPGNLLPVHHAAVRRPHRLPEPDGERERADPSSVRSRPAIRVAAGGDPCGIRDADRKHGALGSETDHSIVSAVRTIR